MPRRPERVAGEIRETMAGIVAALKDPRVGFVTVTRVELTPDLRVARVFVGVLGDEEQRKRTLQGLRQASGFVRRELGRRVRMRHTPEVVFELDRGLDATERVGRLLEEAGFEPGVHGRDDGGAGVEAPAASPRDDEDRE